MKKIFKFINLTTKARHLLLKTVILLGLVRLGLWLLPFSTLRQLLDKIRQLSSKSLKATQIEISQIVWAVDLSSRYCFGEVKCLAKALTTQILMSSYGYCSQLQIGVAKSKQGNLEAHAWVENEGKVLVGHLPDLCRFTPLTSWDGAER